MTIVKQWYLIAYDIHDPRRLQRVGYFMRKHALALQRSVYMAELDRKELEQLMQGIKELVVSRRDDVRIYPFTDPGDIWAAGIQSGSLSGLHSSAPDGLLRGIVETIGKLLRRGRRGNR